MDATRTLTGSSTVKSTVPLRPVRVLLDARKLGDGGIGTYVSNLIHGLRERDDVELAILCDPHRAASTGMDVSVRVIAENARRYSLDEMMLMPRRIRFADFDVFHVPHYTLPFGVPIPTVITVHDLIHIYAPERFYYPFISRPVVRSALSRASRVITVSNASFQQIKKFSAQDPLVLSKLRVIPNSVDADLFQPAPSTGLGKHGDYLVAVFSNNKPHKGLDDLIAAYRMLGAEGHAHKRLVLVGPGTEKIKGRSFGAAQGTAGEILALGAVNRDVLKRLYAHAAALVVPSTAEGFCLPVLEAHACGVPVVTRPVPAVLELTTSFDVVCADMTVETLKEGIGRFLARSELSAGRDDLKAHAGAFSVEATAEAVVGVYAEAAGLGAGAAQEAA